MKHSKTPLSRSAKERLPSYFRALRTMLLENQLRITSQELAERSGNSVTLIRSDFKRFESSGQPGYGYSVRELYTEIASRLGVAAGLSAVCIGNLESRSTMEGLCGRCGVRMLDVLPPNLPQEQLQEAVRALSPDIGVILHSCREPEQLAACLADAGVSGILNYTDQTLSHPRIPIRNCALSDALLLITADIHAEREIT